MHAIEHIHEDLSTLKHQRKTAIATYAVLVALFIGVFFLQPAGPNALQRDTGWSVAFALLLIGALLGAMLTIGYPLVSRATATVGSVLIVVGCSAAMFMTIDPQAAGPAAPLKAGMHCFMFGTAVSALAMAVLGVLSGRVWRRFPDPGFSLAMGMTGLGLAALHLRCGGQDALHLLGFHFTPLLVIYGLAHVAVRVRDRMAADEATSLGR